MSRETYQGADIWLQPVLGKQVDTGSYVRGNPEAESTIKLEMSQKEGINSSGSVHWRLLANIATYLWSLWEMPFWYDITGPAKSLTKNMQMPKLLGQPYLANKDTGHRSSIWISDEPQIFLIVLFASSFEKVFFLCNQIVAHNDSRCFGRED